ncbi:VOC family protein [Ferrimonas balearica]|uniref:VOC family protein n=1 Tax=Ferrimonas balearica TaxID=44012 RepID=UPI001C999CB5|nr:VOC family protein [Ferrimonas balearica]MBY5992866.1 VOC family protein [Ferrimonas balearica]
MRNPVGWFEIYVSDLDRAKAFYQQVFDTTLSQINPGVGGGPEMWAFPWVDEGYGAAGAICHMEGVPAGANSTLVYFSCDDCAVEESRVADAGGTLVRPKMSIGEYGFISIASDPDGNMIGLHSHQ